MKLMGFSSGLKFGFCMVFCLMSNALLAQLVINEYSPLKGTFDAFGKKAIGLKFIIILKVLLTYQTSFYRIMKKILQNGHFLPCFFHRDPTCFSIALTLTRYFMTLASAPTTLILRYRWENPRTYLPPTKP